MPARLPGGHGLPARLTTEQEAAVRAQAASGAFRTATEVHTRIADQFGVLYGAGSISGVLARLRPHPNVPRPVNAKAGPAEPDAWKRGATPRP